MSLKFGSISFHPWNFIVQKFELNLILSLQFDINEKFNDGVADRSSHHIFLLSNAKKMKKKLKKNHILLYLFTTDLNTFA